MTRRGTLPPRFLLKSSRGSVITEFAFSSLIVITMLVTTVEFGIELFARQMFEREAVRAGLHYAETRSKADTNQFLQDSAPFVVRGCLDPVKVRLFNNAAGVSMTSDSVGFNAQDNGGDDSGVIARVSLDCSWRRITPVLRSVFGAEANFHSETIVRMRD